MVMKKTRGKHLLRTIKKNGVSFFAVAFIAAVSIAIFIGLQSAASAIIKEANRYFDETNLETLEITSANGITKEDIDALSSFDGVDTAEGAYSTMVIMNGEQENIIIQAISLSEKLNQAVILDGKLPVSSDEIAVEEKFSKEIGIKVGDTIVLEHDGALKEETFKVTAIINHPFFCCADIDDVRGKSTVGIGSAGYYVAVSLDAFDASYYADCFSKVYVKNNALHSDAYYTDAYKDAEAAWIEKLEVLGEERSTLRYDSLKAEVDGEIGDAENELKDAKADLEDAKAELADEKEKLENALKSIESNLEALNIEKDLDKAVDALAAFGPMGEPLIAAIEEYQDGLELIADAEQEVLDAEKEIVDAEIELEDAKAEAAEIEKKDWIISGRNDVGDIRAIETIVEGIQGLSYAMSVIFLLVATVVCHAAISRMIDEQRVLIGAQKALGFSSGEVLKHYMVYNTLCALLGVCIGWLGSVIIVEILVLWIFTPEFLLGNIALTFVWGQALLTAVICFTIFLTTTYVGCSKLVRQPATELLRGEVPVQGRKFFFEDWKGYKKLSLYSRTMIKNVLNDKGRMMTTVMGVVGCIALLVICFSLKWGIEDSSVIHFDKYFLYENRLVVNTEKGELSAFEAVLEEEDVTYIAVQDKLKNFRVGDGSWENAHVITTDDFEALKEFIVLEDIETGKIAENPTEGLLVSRKCAEMNGLKAGSVVELMDSEGNAREAVIAGVVEHYLLYHQFVTSDSYYEEIMGEDVDSSVFLLKGNIDGLYDKVHDMDGFMSLKDNSAYTASAAALNMVIAICLVLSAVMAVLVLLNQIVMHINRKSRELAVMRINGYTLKETKAYVYKDNVILTIMGLILGSGFGVVLSYLVIRIIETGANRYVRTPNITACLCACVVGSVFALIVNLIALRKVNKLNLTNVSSN